jgi:hypothetical protein
MIASQNARLEVVQALLTNWAVVNAKENAAAKVGPVLAGPLSSTAA